MKAHQKATGRWGEKKKKCAGIGGSWERIEGKTRKKSSKSYGPSAKEKIGKRWNAVLGKGRIKGKVLCPEYSKRKATA